MRETMEKIYGYLIQYGINFIAAILIFIIGKWAARLVSTLLERVLLKSKIEKTLASFAKNIIYFMMLTFVAIAALNATGNSVNGLIQKVAESLSTVS